MNIVKLQQLYLEAGGSEETSLYKVQFSSDVYPMTWCTKEQWDIFVKDNCMDIHDCFFFTDQFVYALAFDTVLKIPRVPMVCNPVSYWNDKDINTL